MAGMIQREVPGGLPTIPISFEAQHFRRSTQNGMLSAFGYMQVFDALHVIGFSFRSEDAPTDTYRVPDHRVFMLTYFFRKELGTPYIEHTAARGTIEFNNDQPVERIWGRLSFETTHPDRTVYNVTVHNFNIRGIDPF